MLGHVPKPQLRPAYQILPPILQEMRETAGLSQRELADHLGVAQNTIHRMEVGSRRCDPVELIDWTRACGASPRSVFDRLVRATPKRR